MKFRDLVIAQKLNEAEFQMCMHTCKQWERFSKAVGKMNKQDLLKMLKFLIENRPHSKTLGEKAVARFNTLNKARWEDLKNGKILP